MFCFFVSPAAANALVWVVVASASNLVLVSVVDLAVASVVAAKFFAANGASMASNFVFTIPALVLFKVASVVSNNASAAVCVAVIALMSEPWVPSAAFSSASNVAVTALMHSCHYSFMCVRSSATESVNVLT